MARDWREIGKDYRPNEEFDSAWALYQRAARLIIDRAVTVQLTHGSTEPSVIYSPYVAELLGKADEGAVEVAKHHLATMLGAAAYLDDLKTFGGDRALRALLLEADPDRW